MTCLMSSRGACGRVRPAILVLRSARTAAEARRFVAAGLGLVLALALALALVGCGGAASPDPPRGGVDSSSPRQAGPSSTPSTLPAGVPTQAPTEPADLRDDEDGAVAFARFMFDSFYFNFFRNDAAAIRALGRCPSCENAIDKIRELEAARRFQVPDRPFRPRLITQLYEEDGTRVMGVSYDTPPGQVISSDGRRIETVAPEKKKYMEVAVRWEGDRWSLQDLAITD